MILAIVSDIHANMLALSAFREWLDSRPDIHRVLNAGDLINIGPRPAETAETALDDPRFIHVMGNNEEMLADPATADGGNNRHRRWSFGRLPNPLTARLAGLPKEFFGEFNGHKVHMTHARPGHLGEFPLLYGPHTIADFRADYADLDAEIFIFGHTHEPFYAKIEDRHFINPGAMGFSQSDFIPVTLLHLAPDQVRVEFTSIPWKRASLAREYFERDVPDKEYILSHFFGINSF
jgi:putative phosphoesterase